MKVDKYLEEKYDNFSIFVKSCICKYDNIDHLEAFLSDDITQFLIGLKILNMKMDNIDDELIKLSRSYNLDIDNFDKEDYIKFKRYILLFLRMIEIAHNY